MVTIVFDVFANSHPMSDGTVILGKDQVLLVQS